MVERSKGIPADIDLTEDRAFATGVKPLATENPIAAGELPWDESGILRRQGRSHDELAQWITVSGISEIMNSSFDEYLLDGITCGNVGGHISSNNEEDIIEMYRKTADVWFLFELSNPMVISGGGRLLYTPDMVDRRYRDLKITYSTYTINYDNPWSSTSNTVSPLISSGNFTNDVDITPYRFDDLSMTIGEFNDGIITGKAPTVARKIALRDHMKKVQHVLNLINGHRASNIPKYAETTKAPAGGNMSVLNKFDWLDFGLDLDPEKFHRDLGFDQSDFYAKRIDKTIDYFFQRVCDDRGLCLIRRPRNSHELRVDVENREFIEEADVPVAASKHLTYEKFFMLETPRPSWSRRIWR